MASDDEAEMEAIRRLREQLPASFGAERRMEKQEQVGMEPKAKEKRTSRIGPPRPTAEPTDEEEPPERSESTNNLGLPISSETSLVGHKKIVTAIAVDRSGARVATGGRDCQVLLYDFGGMNSNMSPFRHLQPCGAHPVRSLEYEPCGDSLLVVSGAPTAALLARDGTELGQTSRGDMYVRDLKNTRGHIMALTEGHWHPSDKNNFVTSSEDGTLRLWDPERLQNQKVVIKPTQVRPGRVGASTCCFHPNGRLVAAGLTDGSIQVWDVGAKTGQNAAVGLVAPPKEQMVSKQDWKYVLQTKRMMRGAHQERETISCVRITPDGNQIVSRCTDQTLKVWDLRNPGKPLALFSGLPANYEQTDLCFSPDGQHVLTCTSAEENLPGSLVFLNRQTMQLEKTLRMPGHAVRVQWHPQLNQIFVGCGDKDEGSTQILYDNTLSVRGALLAVKRKVRKIADSYVEERPVIYTPHALPLFREEPPLKRRKEKGSIPMPQQHLDSSEVKDPRSMPQGKLLTQYLLKQRGMVKQNDPSEDPRNVLLARQEEIDRSEPTFTKAYAKTQPNPVFAESSDED
eukprot:scaffold649_cov347-Pavlova_lutheri.AAC.23